MQETQLSGRSKQGSLTSLSSKLMRVISVSRLGTSISTASPGLLRKGEQVVINSPDKKALRMFEIHAERSYDKTWPSLRQQSILLYWTVRGMLLDRLKRLFDIAVSLLTIFLAAPIWVITAIAVKLESPGPILFQQERVGRYGKPFQCYKFRSMYVDAEERKAELMALNEADEIVFKIKDDPRVTRVGRIIRKLSLDELPQLLNVLKGDMSLVGPRPPVPIEVVQYEYETYQRLEAVPGITGLQQISGRSDLTFKRWVELDVQYIHERSIRKDILILLLTIPTVISRKGAY